MGTTNPQRADSDEALGFPSCWADGTSERPWFQWRVRFNASRVVVKPQRMLEAESREDNLGARERVTVGW